MDNFRNWIYVVVAITAAVIAVEARYASSGHVKQVEQRLEQKIDYDRMDNLQERMWKLEDRYGPECEMCPSEVKDEYRELTKEYKFLQHKYVDVEE